MRSIFSKFALVATLGLALAFTFSCSAVDDAINSSSSSSGGGEQKCGGVVYDTDTYRCEAGELIGKCKGVDYYPAYQQCVGGVVVDGGSSSPSVGSSSSSSVGGSTTNSLDGIWENSAGRQVSISGNTGILIAFGTSDALTQSAINQGFLKIGDQFWRNITSTGNLTWSGEGLVIGYYTDNPNVAVDVHSSTRSTFTLSADGQTLTHAGGTWTRKQ